MANGFGSARRNAEMKKSTSKSGPGVASKSLDGIAKKRQSEMKASMSGPKGKSKGMSSQAGKNGDAFRQATSIKNGQSKLPKTDKARGLANSGKGQGSSPAAKQGRKKV